MPNSVHLAIRASQQRQGLDIVPAEQVILQSGVVIEIEGDDE